MQCPIFRLGLLAFVAFALVAGCATVGPFAVAAAPAGAQGPLRMNATRVDVTLTNKGRKPARYVAVRCRFYDGDGRPLEVGAAYFSNLAGGGAATESISVARTGVARSDCAIAPKGAGR